MAGGASPPIVSEAEIQAALAEAEAQATSIPSLDDGQPPAVVSVPVETAAPLRPLPRESPPEAAATAPTTPGVSPPPAVTPAPAPGGAPSGPAEAQAAASPAESSAEPAVAAARWWGVGGRIVDLLYSVIDGVLWALNRPFEKLSAETRHLLGLLALVRPLLPGRTVTVSLTAAYLLPRLCPPRDAVSQLTRQSAALQQMVEASPTTDPP